MSLDTILKEITAGLTGNSKDDLAYLKSQMEKYKDHELSQEILRACGRLMYELIPDDKKKELENLIENDAKGTEATIKEIRFNVFEGNIEKAFNLSEALVSKIEKAPMFENDSASEYYSFNELFQEILYDYYNKPKRDIRKATIPYAEIFYIHGNLLFELKRLPEAREYLKKALRWNPASCKIAFEYIETFKAAKDYEKFFELTKEQFKYAYRREDVARCYRNLGFYFVEKEEYSVAAGCLLSSLLYEADNKMAQSELYYIQEKAPNYDKPTPELLDKYSEKYGYPVRACEDVIGLAGAYGKHALDDNQIDFAIYFLEIYCGLTDDSDAIAVLEQLKAQRNEED